MSDKKIGIVGIGKAGINIVSTLHNLRQAQQFTLMAIDTDKESLQQSPITETNKLLLGNDWRQGNGCGGDMTAGGRVFSHERSKLNQFLGGYDLLFFAGGLGRGTASGGVSIIASELSKMKIPAIFVLTLPFVMEGPAKNRAAENILKSEIHERNNVIITIPNDLLFSKLDSNCTLNEAFELSNIEVAKSLLALALCFSGGNLLAANYADLLEIVAQKKHFAAIGIGTASAKDGENRFNRALEKMLMSPLLGGLDKLQESDALIVSLIGGNSLGAADTKYLLEKVNSFVGENTNLAVNFSTNEDFGESIMLSTIAIKFDKSAMEDKIFTQQIPTTPSSKKRRNDKDNGQASLDLVFNERGIFEKTNINYHEGVDLDIPAYQRKNINLK